MSGSDSGGSNVRYCCAEHRDTVGELGLQALRRAIRDKGSYLRYGVVF